MSGDGRPARVAVEARADRPERTFTYLLPADRADARPGSLVLVPYGRRLALGYLLADEPEPTDAELRQHRGQRRAAVSYTHLTLPTTERV